jgi:hypothetical protein
MQAWNLFLSNVGNKVEVWSGGIVGALEYFSRVGTRKFQKRGRARIFKMSRNAEIVELRVRLNILVE